MAIPETYSAAPGVFQKTLQRSHVEFEKGWPGISLEGYLELLEKEGHLAVMKEVFDRTQNKLPAIWTYIDVALYPWTYAAGHQVSQGFKYRCSKPDEMLKTMRAACGPNDKKFCEDKVNCHGPRDCFREVITSGPGLHVCITQPAHRGTELHDLHIDQFQMVCKVEENGKCDYEHLTVNSAKHYQHSVPWWLGENVGKPFLEGLAAVGKGIAQGGERLGPDGKPTYMPRGPKY